MKKTWKKLLAAGCALSMLMAMPGVKVLADELQEETAIEVDSSAFSEFEIQDGAESATEVEIIPEDEDMVVDEEAPLIISETEDVLEESSADVMESIVGESEYGFYMYSDNGSEVTIDSYSGTDTIELKIPETIEDKPVTVIGSNAFSGCSNLKMVDIPASVYSVSSRAFYGCRVFFASSFWKKLQTKMENVASPKWRKLQALSDRRVLPSETCSIHC